MIYGSLLDKGATPVGSILKVQNYAEQWGQSMNHSSLLRDEHLQSEYCEKVYTPTEMSLWLRGLGNGLQIHSLRFDSGQAL